ncbi:MAG TPA: hypothetical protein PLP95_10585, partial [Microthrixaceae bacterium]|nr:hypothetical protein [Microthrixaceae bacterium]
MAKKRSGGIPLLLTTVLSIAACVAVIIAGWKPVLGLDLQGGVSVVLQPVADGEKLTDISADTLEQTKRIIQTRVDAIGVAEPEISVQGSTIVLELPGSKDQEQVLELVGRTAELRFRPLVAASTNAPPADAEERVAKLRAQFNVPEGVTAESIYNESYGITGTDATGTDATGTDGLVAEDGGQITTDDGTVITEGSESTPTTAAVSGDGTGGGRKAPLQTTTAAPTTAAPTTAADPAADP